MAEIGPDPPTPMDPSSPESMVSSGPAQIIGLLEEQPLLETAQKKATVSLTISAPTTFATVRRNAWVATLTARLG